MYGIERGLDPPGPVRLPATLVEAAALFEGSTLAAEAFGIDVVEHYVNNPRVELATFRAAVNDCERMRGFERLQPRRPCGP